MNKIKAFIEFNRCALGAGGPFFLVFLYLPLVGLIISFFE